MAASGLKFSRATAEIFFLYVIIATEFNVHQHLTAHLFFYVQNALVLTFTSEPFPSVIKSQHFNRAGANTGRKTIYKRQLNSALQISGRNSSWLPSNCVC